MIRPPIEVLMAVRNGAAFVEEQVRSILPQLQADDRILIRDNASTDHTPKILEKLSFSFPQIRPILGKENKGVLGNFATLAALSTADYLFFSDADDVWLPYKIEMSMECLLQKESETGKVFPLLFHSDLVVVDVDLKEKASSFWKYSQIDPARAYLPASLLMENFVTGCTLLVNRPLLHLAMPIPEEAIMHDAWLALVAAFFGNIITCKDPTLLYRQHSHNTLGAQSVLKKAYAMGISGGALFKKNMKKKMIQADSFYHRYRGFFSPKQEKIVREFIELPSYSFLEKRKRILKNKYLYSSYLKNIYSLLFI